jgi:hypothetical protein
LQRIQTHAALQARIVEQHKARAEAERSSADLAERLDDAQRAAHAARQLHERTRDSHESAMAQLRSELREQAELGRTLHAALEEADAVVMREREKLQEAEIDFAGRLRAAEAALFDHRDRFQRDMSELGERLDEAHQRAAMADTTIAEVRAELDARNASIADHRTRIGSLTSERANLEGQLRALMESMDQARGQLEALTAEANRASAEVEALRNTEAALVVERDGLQRQLAQTRNRVDELTAIRAVKNAEFERLTQHLGIANSRVLNLQTERDDIGRNTEAAITALHDKLEAANNQVVANALREMDARVRLDGIDAHLALSQQAIDLYRADPAAFRAAALAYPQKPEDASEVDTTAEDLISTAKALHGRAADVSRELANTLEAAAQQDPTTNLAAEARLQASEASHREAMEKLHAEFAERLASVGRVTAEKAAFDTSADTVDTVIIRIEATLGTTPPESQPDDNRQASQCRRLEHILHVLDANAAKAKPAPALPPLKPDFLARPTVVARPRPVHAEASAYLPSAAPTPARAVNAPVSPVGPGGWVDRNISTWVPPPEAPAPRTLVQRADNWVKAYPETYRLTRLQRDLRAQFEPMGLKPRVFDADYYLSQGSIEPHTNALRHYLLVGENEGRRPILGFDPTYYRKHFRNPPAGADSLLGHFLSHGAEQGLSPSAELASLQADAKKAGMTPLEFFFRWSPTSAPKPAA